MKAVMYTTAENGERLEDVLYPVNDEGEENQVLNIYEELTFQKLESFGGAVTDAAGYVFSCMPRKEQEELLNMYFRPEQMGYERVRVHMDSCDFCTHMYEADSDETDENLEKFSFADTERYIIPLLEAAQEKAGKS